MMSFFSYKDVDDGDDDVDYEEDVNLRLPEVMNRCCSHGWSARDEASTPGRSSRLPHSSRNGLWRTGAHRNGDILPPSLPSFLVHPDPPSRCPYLPSSLPLFAIGLTHLGRLLQRDSKRVDNNPNSCKIASQHLAGNGSRAASLDLDLTTSVLQLMAGSRAGRRRKHRWKARARPRRGRRRR